MLGRRRAGGGSAHSRGGRDCWAGTAAPAVDSSQVGGHVVLPVELFMTNFAGVGVPLEVGRHVVPVEVAGVGVGVVANFTTVGVLWWTLVRTETANADGIWTLGRTQTGRVVCVEVGKFGFDFLLHLKVHQVGAGARWAGLRLGVHTTAGAGQGETAFVGRFGKRVDEVRKVGVISVGVPEHLGLSRVVSWLAQRKVLVFLLDCLRDVFVLDTPSGVSAVAVRFLHWEIQHRRCLGKVVVVGRR